VQHHQTRRPPYWTTIEQPFYLAQTLREHDAPEQVMIVDCLTLWLAQCICKDCDKPAEITWEAERENFLKTLPTLKSQVFLVSNEVGMGIVPLGEINRQFQDEQGRLNQAVAQLAGQVTFVAAGLPLVLKG
jgi:adenosylcobinamide kinase/adenosylcobinamide-phosphate guanylyltransferase